MEIKPLSVLAMQSEGMDLLREHYEELTLHKDIVKLNVDWQAYFHWENANMLCSLGLYEEGRLIGYSVFILSQHAHYKDLKVASNDVLFLQKDKRKGRAGLKLIKESERVLKNLGVSKVVWHCKYDHVAGELLQRLGYINEEYIMGKILGD